MANEQLCIVVGIVVDDQGRLLLGKRSDKEIPTADNRWELLGGKVDFAEDPSDAVVREVKEESGLDVIVDRLLPKAFSVLWDKIDGSTRHVIILPYVCSIVGGQLHDREYDHKILELNFFERQETNDLPLLKVVPEIIDLYFNS